MMQSTFKQQLRILSLKPEKGGPDKPADKPSPSAMEKFL